MISGVILLILKVSSSSFRSSLDTIYSTPRNSSVSALGYDSSSSRSGEGVRDDILSSSFSVSLSGLPLILLYSFLEGSLMREDLSCIKIEFFFCEIFICVFLFELRAHFFLGHAFLTHLILPLPSGAVFVSEWRPHHIISFQLRLIRLKWCFLKLQND